MFPSKQMDFKLGVGAPEIGWKCNYPESNMYRYWTPECIINRVHWQTSEQGIWEEAVQKHQNYWAAGWEFLRTILLCRRFNIQLQLYAWKPIALLLLPSSFEGIWKYPRIFPKGQRENTCKYFPSSPKSSKTPTGDVCKEDVNSYFLNRQERSTSTRVSSLQFTPGNINFVKNCCQTYSPLRKTTWGYVAINRSTNLFP